MMSGAKKRVPKRRFKEFLNAGDWEQYKLADILSRRKENRRIDSAYPRLAFAAGQGVIPLSERRTNNRDQLISDEKNKKYLVTYYNDIVYNPANLKYGAIDRNKYGQGVISPIYVTFTSNICSGFIEHIVKSYEFKEKALSFEEGTVTKRQAVNPDNLLKIDVVITPNSKEQEKISKLFELIDQFITLHQYKLDKLQATKKALLQEMFPEEGQDKPKRRFKGFTDTWEQRKLRNLLEQPITDGPHETPELYDSGIPFISVDAIVDNKIDFTKMRGYISKEYDDICAKKYKPQINDVYLVKSGATIGKVAIVDTYDDFNIWSPLAAMRCGSITNPYFLYMLLQTQDLQSQVFNKASHGTQPNLSMRQLETFTCKVPKIEEQKLISRFLKQLDDVITLYQRKLDKLKNLKQAYLNEIFV